MKRKRARFPLNYSVSKAILDMLIDWGEHTTLFESPYMHMKRMWREERGIPSLKRWRYNQAIRYLQSAAQLKVVERDGRVFLKLTKKGKLRALFNRLGDDFKKSRIKWDGKWRLIIWDIPEIARRQRDRIRRFVKDLDFHQLQKSVFITPYPLPGSAVTYLRESDLLGYIRFLRVDMIENDRFLKKRFKLK